MNRDQELARRQYDRANRAVDQTQTPLLDAIAARLAARTPTIPVSGMVSIDVRHLTAARRLVAWRKADIASSLARQTGDAETKELLVNILGHLTADLDELDAALGSAGGQP